MDIVVANNTPHALHHGATPQGPHLHHPPTGHPVHLIPSIEAGALRGTRIHRAHLLPGTRLTIAARAELYLTGARIHR